MALLAGSFVQYTDPDSGVLPAFVLGVSGSVANLLVFYPNGSVRHVAGVDGADPATDGQYLSGWMGLPVDANGSSVIENSAVDTGAYETTPPHLILRVVPPINMAGTAFAIRTKRYYPDAVEGNAFAIDITTQSCILEMNTPAGEYCMSMQVWYRSGTPQLQINNIRYLLPEYDGTDPTLGHHYGTCIGTPAIAGETDGDKRWRSMSALFFESPTKALATSGDVTFTPVREGEVGLLVSSGNVTSLTLATPDDGTTRLLDGLQVTLVLKQGGVGHTWPSTIANALKPAGVAVKATTTNGAIDTLHFRYCQPLGKWLLVGNEANLV